MRLPLFSALWARLWKPGWRALTVLVVVLLLHSLWASIEAGRFRRIVDRSRAEEGKAPRRSWLTVAPADNAARYYEAAWALSVRERGPGVPRDEPAWLRSMQPAIEMLDRGATLPECDFSQHRPHHLAWGSAPAKAVSLRTRELIQKGDWNAAVASLTTSLHYLRVFSADVPLVRPQSRIDVVETLLTDMQLLIEASSSTELRGVRDLLDAENGLNHVESALRIERDLTLRRVVGDLSGRPGSLSLGIERWLLRPLICRIGASAVEFESAMIEASRAPWPERIRGVLRTPLPRSRVARMMLGWLREGALGITRSIAKSHAMAVCLRIEEYRRARGALPETLDTLPAATGEKELPVDPFTGQALRYRREDGAYVVYSVGEDEKDDGGALMNRQGPAKDYGYRIRTRT